MTDELREQVAKLGEAGEKTQADGPNMLSPVDKLELQNAFLKFHAVMLQRTNIKTQMEVLRRDAATADVEAQKTQAALAAKRAQIEKDYGVDLQKVTVNEAGEFIPLDPSQLPFHTQGPTNGGN